MGHKLRDLASEITLGSHISCGEAPLVYKRAITLSILRQNDARFLFSEKKPPLFCEKYYRDFESFRG